jgi:ankyrin repeat protein
VAEALLKAGCNKDLRAKSNGWTALLGAAAHGHVGVVEALLKAGCNKDVNGSTALHRAAEYGHVGVVEALLKAGCNPDMQDTRHGNGWTALHCAATAGSCCYVSEKGRVGVVEALLKAGCNPHMQDTSGKTALQLAQNLSSRKSRKKGRFRDDEVVAMLKEHLTCGGRK